MFSKFLAIISLIGCALAQHPHHPHHQYSPQALAAFAQLQQASHQPSPSSASQLQSTGTPTTPKPYFPPAQVHYVNIGEELAGDYKFGYDTGKSGAGQSFREESRLPDGTVKGAYGYIDTDGKQRIVKYTAGIEGFKVESDEEAPGQSSGPSSSAPAPQPRPQPVPVPQPVIRTYSPPPQPQPQPQPQPVPQPQPQPTIVHQPSPTPVSIVSSAAAAGASSDGSGPQTITIRSYAPMQQLQPVTIRSSYQPSGGAKESVLTSGKELPEHILRALNAAVERLPPISSSSSSPSSASQASTASSPASSPSGHQPLGGYTPVAHTTGTSQPQYITTVPSSQSAAPAPIPIPVPASIAPSQAAAGPQLISSGGTNQYSLPSPTSGLSSYEPTTTVTIRELTPAIVRQIASGGSSSSGPSSASIIQAVPPYQAQFITSPPQARAVSGPPPGVSTLTAVLAQRVPSSSSRSLGGPSSTHIASMPRIITTASGAQYITSGGGGGGVGPSPASINSAYSPSLAAAYHQQAQLQAQGQVQPEQETTTWGPPVINKELLSYNIGVQQG